MFCSLPEDSIEHFAHCKVVSRGLTRCHIESVTSPGFALLAFLALDMASFEDKALLIKRVKFLSAVSTAHFALANVSGHQCEEDTVVLLHESFRKV